MKKTTSVPKVKVAPLEEQKPLPSIEEFRAAVRYSLVHDLSMPELYADELLDYEPEFLEERRKTCRTEENAVAQAADDLVIKPSKGRKWIVLEDGERVAGADQVVLEVNQALGDYLDCLVTLGIHGPSRDAVAGTMLAKGLESVFPLIVASKGRKGPWTE